MTVSVLVLSSRSGCREICRVIAPLGIQVRCCESGLAALSSALESPPNLVLIDGRADLPASLQLCRSFRSIEGTHPVPLVVLSGPASSQDRLDLLEAGADDCWTEKLDSREFLLRLRAFARRFEAIQATRVLRYADIELDVDRYRARRNGTLLDLTPMQLKLLRHLMENPTVVFSRRQLLRHVWENPDLNEGAVTACMVRLRRALNAAGGPNLIKSVACAGYALDAEASAGRQAAGAASLHHL